MSINLELTDNQYLHDKNDIDRLIKKDDSLIFSILKQIYHHRKDTGKKHIKQDKWKYLKNRYIDDINNNNTDTITDIIELYNANLRADQEQKQDKSHTTATRLLSKQMRSSSETVAITEAITSTQTDTQYIQQLIAEFSKKQNNIGNKTERLITKEVNEFRLKFSKHPNDIEKLKTLMQTFDDSKQQVIVRLNDLLQEISHGEISTTDFFSTEYNSIPHNFAMTHADGENFTDFYLRIYLACLALAENDKTLIQNLTEDSFRSELTTLTEKDLTPVKADLNFAAGMYYVVYSPIARQAYLCEEEKFFDIFRCGIDLTIYLNSKKDCNIYVNKLTAVIKFYRIIPQYLIKSSDTTHYVTRYHAEFPETINHLDLSVDVAGKASLAPDLYYKILRKMLNDCRKCFLNSKEYALDHTDIEKVQIYVSPKMLAKGKFEADDIKIRFPIKTVLKITDTIEPNPLDNNTKIVRSIKKTQAKKKPSHPLLPYYQIEFSNENENNKLSIQLNKFILTNEAFSKILKSTTVCVSLDISSNIFRIDFLVNTPVSKKIYKVLLKSMISGCKELGIYELIEQKTLEALKNVDKKDINKIKDIPIQFSITKATAQDLVKIYSPVTTPDKPLNDDVHDQKAPHHSKTTPKYRQQSTAPLDNDINSRCHKSKKHRRKRRNKRR